MLLNRLFPLILLLAWTAGAVSPLHHPALNPVTVVPVAEHPPLELIRQGELRFAISADTAAEAELPAARRPVSWSAGQATVPASVVPSFSVTVTSSVIAPY